MRMKKSFYFVLISGVAVVSALLVSCAAERQTMVCEEQEYRLSTMTYSPDQRAFAEEELRACREEEAKRKGEAAESRKSIYDKFAANGSNSGSDSTKSLSVAPDGSVVENPGDISVSESLKDSSGEETTSIYDRYKAVENESSQESGNKQ